MRDLVSKLWDWLINRSPKNAATPDVQPGPVGETANSTQGPGPHRVETTLHFQSCIGLLSRLGKESSLLRGPEGELVRASERVGILLGCNHVVTRLQAADEKGRHVRGIAGICGPCFREHQRLLQKGKSQISAFDVERLSLVCTDCAKITVSGQLCCPKHYAAVVGPDGSTIYVDEEQARGMKRQDTVRTALGIVNFLLGEGRPQVPDRQERQKNAPNPISLHPDHIVHYDRPPGARSNQESAPD